MGTWGTKLYDDDVACDIKEDYKNYLSIGMENSKIIKQLMNDYKEELNDDRDYKTFWLVIADLSHSYGKLTEDVKKKAIEIIDSGYDVEIWDTKLKKERIAELKKIKEKINKQIIPKKIPKIKVVKGFYNYGDVLAYKITLEFVKDAWKPRIEQSKYNNCYVLLKVLGVAIDKRGNLPIEYCNEENIVAIYDKAFKNEPSLEDIKKYTSGLILNSLSEPSKFSLRINKRDLKKLNFKIVNRSCNNYDENYKYAEAYGFSRSIDDIDTDIVDSLEYHNIEIINN